MSSRTFYSPLLTSRNEIRLLELAPGKGRDKITCNLKKVSLDIAIQYEALSYVWGDAENTELVNVCNEPFNVTKNLAEALRDLRDPKAVRILWVDALCINQQDIAERTDQVKLMGQVYQRSSSVVVHFPRIHPGITDFIHNMATDQEKHWCGELKALGKTTHCDLPLFQHIFGLFRNPWWERVWTLQEAVLAQKLNFVFGRGIVELSVLSSFTESFFKHYQSAKCCEERTPFKSLPLNIWSRMQHLKSIQKHSEAYKATGLRDFSHVITSQRHRRATNPRDHIFGMLGLLPGYESIVNYELSESQIFTRAVIEDIQRTGTLDILSQVLIPDGPVEIESSHIADLPSWVPNWKQEYYPYYLNDVAYRQNLLPLYNACRDMPAMVEFFNDQCIRLQGIVYDDIVAIGSQMTASSSASWRKDLAKDFATVIYPETRNISTQTYPNIFNPSQTVADAIVRLSCGDVIPLATTHDDASSRVIIKWGCSKRTDPIERTDEITDAITANRRLMRTARGLIGLVPASARRLDKICVLFGGKVPFVIRGEAEEFVFIGDAYVHGLMDGEAVNQAESKPGRLSQQAITLKGHAQAASWSFQPYNESQEAVTLNRHAQSIPWPFQSYNESEWHTGEHHRGQKSDQIDQKVKEFGKQNKGFCRCSVM